jgi:nucleotide-binding universal stress UspA family protein
LGERLTALAAKDNIDLIVVGSHDRSVVERLWEGSISHATLHNAQTSVLCVPVDECPPQLRRRRAKCVVAATDFSTLGDSALPLAYAITEPGGTLHVVHVVPAHDRAPLDFHDIFALDNLKAPSSARDEALAHLRKLTTSIAKSSDKHIELHVLESNNTAEAIAQAGERLQADVLVLGSHGRTGISKAVMGSVASSLLSSSQRPVMLVRETH